MPIYREYSGGEIEVVDPAAFANIVRRMEEAGLEAGSWDWRGFTEDITAAEIVAEELGGTVPVDAPNGVRYFAAKKLPD